MVLGEWFRYHRNEVGEKAVYTTKKESQMRFFLSCRKRDLNPHERNAHTDLNRARLPIPPFLRTNSIVSGFVPNVNTIFRKCIF